MSPILRLAACASALALCACIPEPGGQCATDADCGFNLSCQAGLCETRPPRPCSPACATGLHCNDGTCNLDTAPVVTWSSPEDGSAAASGVVSLALSITTPATDVVAAVRVSSSASGTATVTVPLAPGADGLYRGLLYASGLSEHDWTMTPVIEAASASFGGPSRRLRIDRTGPTIELYLPVPSAGAFLRTDTVEVRARIVDNGAGIDATTPAAIAPGMSDLTGTRLAATEWSFQVPLSSPTFNAASGPLTLGIRARDLLGNESIVTGAVPVTRALWNRSVGAGLPIRSSPAIDAHHLFIGTDSGQVLSLDRATSAVLWSRALTGPVSASPALGAAALYTASEGGDVRALDPNTGNVLWTCVDLPAGLSFTSSPAIDLVSGLVPGATALETIALANTGSFQAPTSSGLQTIAGGLFLLEGTTGFVKPGGARSCFLLAPVSGGRSSPAIDLDGTLYAGGDDGQAHALSIATDTSGAFSLNSKWNQAASDDVSASPAVSAAGIAFGDESGKLFWLNPDGSPQTAEHALADKLFASPVFAWNTLLALDRSGMIVPFSSSPIAPAAVPPLFAAATIPGVSDVESTPAIGADGTIYMAAGRALYAYAPGGTQLWSMPLPGTATTSSPTLACDGTLYIGDSSGTLSAIATDSLGLAPGWARFHHDARNTGNAALGACE